MSIVAFMGALELGLIYALLALGIFVSYRILGVADLTVEGSFTTGAAVCAVFVVAGQPILGIILAIFAGAVAGLCSAFMQTKMRIQPILAGILTMTALYSVNLGIMGGRSNIAMLRDETLFTIIAATTGDMALWRTILPLIIIVTVGVILGLFFHTRMGLSIRATGDNEAMVKASSVNTTFTKSVGLAIGNALAALSGALIAQYQSFADISMGLGMVVVALASVIIGEAIFGRRTVVWNISAVIIGAVIYRVILAFVLSFRLNPANLRGISALIVTIAISYPAIKSLWHTHKLKRKARLNHVKNH
ncbi:MAG: ABC transporter permease [Firmicutes bacterium]|nr:ABC transporter permease [Bacillota bacterium]